MSSPKIANANGSNLCLATEPDLQKPPGSDSAVACITYAKINTSEQHTDKVTANNVAVMQHGFITPNCQGGIAGGSGVKSGTWNGKTECVQGSSTVTIKGQAVYRNGDAITMNNGNARGEIVSEQAGIKQRQAQRACLDESKAYLGILVDKAQKQLSQAPVESIKQFGQGAKNAVSELIEDSAGAAHSAWSWIKSSASNPQQLIVAIQDNLRHALMIAREIGSVAQGLLNNEYELIDLISALGSTLEELFGHALCGLADELAKKAQQGQAMYLLGGIVAEALMMIAGGLAAGKIALRLNKTQKTLQKLAPKNTGHSTNLRTLAASLKKSRQNQKSVAAAPSPQKTIAKGQDGLVSQGTGKANRPGNPCVEHCGPGPKTHSPNPINYLCGNKYLPAEHESDLHLPGLGIDLEISRQYDSRNTQQGWHGQGWSSHYELKAKINAKSNTLDIIDAYGRTLSFPQLKEGQHSHSESEPYGLSRSKQGTYTLYTLDPEDPTYYTFGKKHNDNEYILSRIAKKLDEQGRHQGINLYYPPQSRLPDLIIHDDGRSLGLHFERRRLKSIHSLPSQGQRGWQHTLSQLNEQKNGRSLKQKINRYIQSQPILLSYTHNEQQQLIEVRQHYDQAEAKTTRRYTYDLKKRLTQRSTEEHSWQYTYNARHQVIEHKQQGSEHTYHITYGQGITQIHECRGQQEARISSYHYTQDHHLTGYRDPEGHAWHYQSNLRGQIEQSLDPLGRTTRYTYSAEGYLTSETDAEGHTWYHQWKRGQCIQSTDPLGHSTHYTYDRQNRLTQSTDPLGRSTRYTYHRHTRHHIESITNPKGGRSTYHYNGQGALTHSIDCQGSLTSYRYPEQAYSPFPQDSRYLGQINYPEGIQSYARYLGGKLIEEGMGPYKHTQEQQRTTHYHHNDLGQLCGSTNPLGEKDHYIRDKLGRIIKHHQSDPNGVIHHSTHYSYDAYDRITQITHESAGQSQSWHYRYTARDQLQEERHPQGHTIRHHYDAAGQRIQSTHQSQDGQQKTIRYHYDQAGRIIQIDHHQARKKQSTHYRYDAAGQLIHSHNNTSSHDYRYDAAGQLIQEKRVLRKRGQEQRDTLEYTYDLLGNRESTTHNGHTLIHLHSAQGQLHEQGQHHQGQYQSLIDHQHDRLGRPTQHQHGQSEHQKHYLPITGDLSQINYGPQQHIRYSYNAQGQRQHEQRNQQTTYSYGYCFGDLVHRIDHRTGQEDYQGYLPKCPAPVYWEGNKREAKQSIPYQTLDHHDGQLHSHKGNHYRYDGFGRLIERRRADGSHQTYHYDLEDQLIRIEHHQAPRYDLGETSWKHSRTDYHYDPFGRRTHKEHHPAEGGIETTTFTWTGDQLLHRIQQRGAHSKSTTWLYEAIGSYVPVMSLHQDGAGQRAYHHHSESNGQTYAITDGQGHLAWEGWYSTRGSLIQSHAHHEDLRDQPLRYQGQYHDEESGLCYNRFRYYDAEIGRFTTPDPLGVMGGFHSYDYPRDPIQWVDPLGLSGKKAKGSLSNPNCKCPGKAIARYGPMNQGPLPKDVTETFRAGSYAKLITQKPTTLYRVYGGSAGEIGAYWTTVKPSGPVQSIVDSALNPVWGNTATKVVSIQVPPGVNLYYGAAAPQGGLVGGGPQVFFLDKVDPAWIIKK
jgi:RHS repeat-associated protein